MQKFSVRGGLRTNRGGRMTKKYVPDQWLGHWLIFDEKGNFVCSCEDSELSETMKNIQEYNAEMGVIL